MKKARFFLIRIVNRFKKEIKTLKPTLKFKKTEPKFDLLIFDDIFPNPLSDWRSNEYKHYLRHFHKVGIYTGNIVNNEIHIPKDYETYVELFRKETDLDLTNHSIEKLRNNSNINTRMAYCLFFHNISSLFPFLEKYSIPFSFTLYPGGGFSLYNRGVIARLKAITSSSLFRGLFVNMPYLKEYAIKQLEVPLHKVIYLYGVPIEVAATIEKPEINRYTIEKLKICFAAHKYMSFGLNKGFDVFCTVANKFKNNNSFEFYVIGNYTPEDNPLGDVENIIYKGSLMPELLGIFFKSMHIIISPVRSHVLYHGNFDGFPTGAALNAVLNGCVLIGTDPHDTAVELGLEDGIDLFLTSDRPSEIITIINILNHDRELLYSVAGNGQNKFHSHLQSDKQGILKIEGLRKLMGNV